MIPVMKHRYRILLDARFAIRVDVVSLLNELGLKTSPIDSHSWCVETDFTKTQLTESLSPIIPNSAKISVEDF